MDAAPEIESTLGLSLNLISADYLRHNMPEILRSMDRGNAFPLVAASPGDQRAVLLPDGSLRYAAIGQRHDLAPGGVAYGLLRGVTTVPSFLRDVEAGLRALKARGFEVTLVMMPYPPDVFSCAKAWICSTLQAIESAGKDIGRRTGLPVLVDYCGAGLAASDFMDSLCI